MPELVKLYTIGLSGWFTMMSSLFGHISYADKVAASIGWPQNSGFQMELRFAFIGISIVGFSAFSNRPAWDGSIRNRYTAYCERFHGFSA